jgi:hypothetical protein
VGWVDIERVCQVRPDLADALSEFARRPGGISPEHAARLAERNDILRRIYRTWQPTLSPHAAANAIRSRFDRAAFSRCKSLVAPRDEPERSFWRIAQLGVRFPGVSQLTEILKNGVLSME